MWPLLFIALGDGEAIMCVLFIDDELFIDELFIECIADGLGLGVPMVSAMAGAAINMAARIAVKRRMVLELLMQQKCATSTTPPETGRMTYGVWLAAVGTTLPERMSRTAICG